jgi:hypothetical protein
MERRQAEDGMGGCGDGAAASRGWHGWTRGSNGGKHRAAWVDVEMERRQAHGGMGGCRDEAWRSTVEERACVPHHSIGCIGRARARSVGPAWGQSGDQNVVAVILFHVEIFILLSLDLVEIYMGVCFGFFKDKLRRLNGNYRWARLQIAILPCSRSCTSAYSHRHRYVSSCS